MSDHARQEEQHLASQGGSSAGSIRELIARFSADFDPDEDGFGSVDRRKDTGQMEAWCTDCTHWQSQGHDEYCPSAAIRQLLRELKAGLQAEVSALQPLWYAHHLNLGHVITHRQAGGASCSCGAIYLGEVSAPSPPPPQNEKGI